MERADCIVIGGGPAGLTAAGTAAGRGLNTILLEKMHKPARKLGITGKGRCNLTNAAPMNEFIAHFGRNGRFLRQAFQTFFSEELCRFIENLGLELVTERGGRIFPASGRATDLVRTLIRWAESRGTIILPQVAVTELRTDTDGSFIIQTERQAKKNQLQEFNAGAVIIATGGMSYPATGSTGDGYRLASRLGHSIIQPRPGLVPVETDLDVIKPAVGLRLRHIQADVYIDGRKAGGQFGELEFYEFGLSGPVILTLSSLISDAVTTDNSVEVVVDLKPALDHQKLDQRLLRDLNRKNTVQELLTGLMPGKLHPIAVRQCGLVLQQPCHQVTGKQRKTLRNWLKEFRLPVTGIRSWEEAIITRGGISLKEVNPNTMESKIVPHLYLIGEILDLDGDTGGYNLQAAFSTGFTAGHSIPMHH